MPRLQPYAERIRKAARNLGLKGCAVYFWHKALRSQHVAGSAYALSSRHANSPAWCRPKTRDIDVFGQIYVDREYRCQDSIASADTIIDCSANVGYASQYFLSRFPAARLIAVEPDCGNFFVAQRNFAPFGERARILNSAAWSRPCGLVISEVLFGDGRERGR
jgi:hypothetical protein